MAVARKIISYILALVLSLCIISSTLLLFVNSSIFNKSNLKKELLETDYYYYIYSIIEDSCNNTILQSGFDNKIMKNVITEKQVQADVDKLIDGLYDNKEINISTITMKHTLEENIQEYIEKNNYEVSGQTKADIDNFVNTIVETYSNHILYSKESVKEISKYLKKVADIVKIATIVLCIITVIFAIILFILYKPALGVSLIIAGGFFIIVRAYSVVNMAINNVLILNWAFSKSVTYILNKLLQNLFSAGVVMFIVGIIIVIIGEIVRIIKLNAEEKD